MSDCGFQGDRRDRTRAHHGLVVLRTPHRDSADALADVLHHAGYATTWQRHTRAHTTTRGALAGIWNGGQLSEAEAKDLSAFCKQMSHDGAPVVTLLDFPRRDRVDLAREVGAAAVVAKPWFNADLFATLEAVTSNHNQSRAA